MKPWRSILPLVVISIILLAAGCGSSGRQATAPIVQTTAPAAGAAAPTAGAAQKAARTPAPPAQAYQKIGGIGILGDSTSDEYRAEDARGGDYAATTLGWVEQLARSRGLDFGPWGTWGEPRRSGYEYNWARTGATAETMLTSGQVTGLARQVAEGRVSYVLLWIGGNDFHLRNGPYEEIYSGALRGSALQKKLDAFAAAVATSMDTILSAGAVKMAVVTVTDQGLAQQAPALFPDAKKRQRVTDAVNALNAEIAALADKRGVLVIDSNRLGEELFDRFDSQGFLEVGGEKINALEAGDDPHHLQLGDHIGHSGTVLSGIIANAVFIEPFNKAFGFGIPPLADEEILNNAGIKK